MGGNMTNQNQNGSINANERNAIMILDDRGEIRDSIDNYLEAVGVEVFIADSVARAYSILEKCHQIIKNAFIDNKLENESGIEFVEEASKQYPDVCFIILTAYPLTKAEKRKIKELGIPVKDKSRFHPDELLKSYEDYVEYREAKKYSDGEKHEEIFTQRVSKDFFRIKYEGLKDIWEEFVSSLVSRIQETNSDKDGAIHIQGQSFTTEKLLEEIREGTQVGKWVVQLHTKVVDDVLGDKK
jgi:response regulator RpfG family c-di-GMP phosphodiesterase